MTIATNNFNRFAVESQLSDFSLPCFSTAAISKNFEEQQSQLYQPGIISCFFIVVLLCLHRQRVLLGLSFYVLLVFFHKLSSFWTVEYFQKAQGPFIQNQCKIFRKTNILPPLVRTPRFECQEARNNSFQENLRTCKIRNEIELCIAQL